MKVKINNFFNDLISYDYILFGVIMFVFILLVIFTIMSRNKKVLSLSLAILALLTLFVVPFVAYSKMHEEIFKKEIMLKSQKKLEFTKAVVVHGKLKNISSRDFESCLIKAVIYKNSSNKLKNFIYRFKPLQKMSIIEEDIVIANEIDFKIIISPFTYSRDFNTTLEASCR